MRFLSQHPARRRGAGSQRDARAAHGSQSAGATRRWFSALGALVLGAALALGAAPATVAVAAVPTGTQAGHTPSGTDLSALPAPMGKNLGTVTVDDTAGVLNQARMRDLMSKVDFYQPTRVAIYTRKGEYSDNINLKTLQYAKTKHPDWISDDPADYGDYWDDGLLIITLSVESANSGQIGTYFGEDRAGRTNNDELLSKIHRAGTSDFRQGRWADGIAAVAQAAGREMNKPWYAYAAVWITTAIAAAAGLFTWGAVVSRRAKRRNDVASQLQAGTVSLARVTTDLDTTELSARTLPTGSAHAADLERRFADFIQQYRQAFMEQQALEQLGPKERSKAAVVQRASDFADSTADLDFTDDAIVQAAALYTRSARWQDAWRAQTAPLLEDLTQLSQLPAAQTDAEAASLAALDSFRLQAQAFVEDISRKLDAQEIDVDQALDGLADVRKHLTMRLDELAKVQIAAFARSDAERAQMEDQLRSSRYGWGRRYGTGSILDVTRSADLFWSVANFNSGYSAGRRSVEHSRAAAARASSSSGVSRGFGGGGGSFSGSGGSSRF